MRPAMLPRASARTPINNKRVRFMVLPQKNAKAMLSEVWHLCWWLLNAAGNRRENVVGIGPNQPDGPHHDHQNHGQHHRIFGDILTLLFPEKPVCKLHRFNSPYIQNDLRQTRLNQTDLNQTRSEPDTTGVQKPSHHQVGRSFSLNYYVPSYPAKYEERVICCIPLEYQGHSSPSSPLTG